MFAPKPISPDSVPGALAKAERYRLLNEPERRKAFAGTSSKSTQAMSMPASV